MTVTDRKRLQRSSRADPRLLAGHVLFDPDINARLREGLPAELTPVRRS